MGGPTKGFRVDPDKLSAVADKVKALLQDLSGETGYIAGNLPEYQKADAQALRDALKDFWSGDDVFASAYDDEHKGVVTTYQQMQKQLTNLERACRTTAEKYGAQDHKSKQDVTHSSSGDQGEI